MHGIGQVIEIISPLFHRAEHDVAHFVVDLAAEDVADGVAAGGVDEQEAVVGDAFSVPPPVIDQVGGRRGAGNADHGAVVAEGFFPGRIGTAVCVFQSLFRAGSLSGPDVRGCAVFGAERDGARGEDKKDRRQEGRQQKCLFHKQGDKETNFLQI